MKISPKQSHTAHEFGLRVHGSDDDFFKWFLLCYLLGKPIQSRVAVQTWHIFMRDALDTPWIIIKAGKRSLEKHLVEGKYTHYNHIMADALLKMSEQLIRMSDGSLLLLLHSTHTEDEFSKLLQKLHGVGPKTAQIIMTETTEYFAELSD